MWPKVRHTLHMVIEASNVLCPYVSFNSLGILSLLTEVCRNLSSLALIGLWI